MKRTVIATARIKRPYYQLIEQGIKKYEIRNESLEGVNGIYYIDSESGEPLGVRVVQRVFAVDRSSDSLTMTRAAISKNDFFTLFPTPKNGGVNVLWVAELGKEIQLEELLKEE